MAPTPSLLNEVDRLWRAANYLSVGQIYLLDNPLLRRPLQPDDIKPRLLGHWGTTPGLNFVYAHLQRIIVEHDVGVLFLAGPGHGGPAVNAHAWLEGSYTDVYPEVSLDAIGMQRLFTQFSFPRGVPSHVSPETPGSIHEGGELGYSLAHAVGAAFDNPGLVSAVVIGDGEAETAALAASWQSAAFLDPVRDGTVLPILHLNGYKIANPTVLARRSDDEVRSYLTSQGWDPIFVSIEVDDEHRQAHERFATALDDCFERITARRSDATDASSGTRRPMPIPMIVLRSPKGWTGPSTVDGQQVENTWRSHQVPLAQVRSDDDHRRQLEEWMRSYRPDELFDAVGRPLSEVTAWLPFGDRRISSIPASNGGSVLRPLELPDHHRFGVTVDSPASTHSEPTRALGHMLRDVFELNESATNFRLFGPDETESNRLEAVYEVTDKAWQLPQLDTDRHLGADGRVMEVLSEHLCQGWLEGYLLTGRHGLFSCYEAFVHIIDSMFNQHAKWLKVHRSLTWRAPIASLNYLLTSHVWRQDHNGFSHQDPGFLDHVTSKGSDLVRVYLPPDTNSLLAVATHCLASRDLVNVIVSGKQPTLDVLSSEDADLHVARGVGIWDWASSNSGSPDVVLACAGDVPTLETLAAVSILRDRLPDLGVRVVNVVDLMRLADEQAHPHGLSDTEFDSLFTVDRPVVFAFHGYPWLIHRLAYRRTNHANFHVRGYKEEGSTTTPFDMVVRNDMDRFHLVIDVIDRVEHLQSRAATLRQEMVDMLARHVTHITTYGEDLPSVRNWQWAP